MLRIIALVLVAAGLVGAAALGRPEGGGGTPRAADHLVGPEWGTVRVLQDEQGRSVGAINTDDEPLPDFVHNLSGALNGPSSPLPTVHFKGVVRNHPDVYTRLETPVIYFYPPGGQPMT